MNNIEREMQFKPWHVIVIAIMVIGIGYGFYSAFHQADKSQDCSSGVNSSTVNTTDACRNESKGVYNGQFGQ